MSIKPNSLLLLVALLLAIACEDLRHHAFQSLYGEWAANDTLIFPFVNSSVADTSLELDVELRVTSSYPSRELWLGVQCVSGGNVSVDTLRCEIFDSLGKRQGTGVGLLYQSSFPAKDIAVVPGDTAMIRISHLMDAPVQGVADVGIRVCGRGRRLSSGN